MFCQAVSPVFWNVTSIEAVSPVFKLTFVGANWTNLAANTAGWTLMVNGISTRGSQATPSTTNPKCSVVRPDPLAMTVTEK